jgi:MFS family permease
MPKVSSSAEQYDLSERRKESIFGLNYKWIVLLNTTLGALMATIDGSILIISLPAIFNGMGVNPLQGGNSSLLLWLILGYTIVSCVSVVAIGRLSDMYGRVKLYNIGFVIFAVSSTAIYISSYLIAGSEGVLVMIIIRLIQGLGGGFLIGNSAAILTDAFPANERGRALGINSIAAVSGSLIGLLVGGVLAAIDWHLIFLISVPVGILGAIWAYFALHELSITQKKQKLDILGNITFAAAVLLILISLTYGIQPYGSSTVGWSNPLVEFGLLAGAAFLIAFILVESRVEDPMFRLWLFKIRAFTAGNLCLLLAGIARGGMQFMLIIWLQGIWLPLHGISFTETPLYAAIDMVPLVAGFLIAGPLCGYLSDKYGPRIFTTTGMFINVIGFLMLSIIPVNFSYPVFAVIIFAIGIGNGMFTSPNTAAIMNSAPPEYRGVSSGIRATLFNLSTVLSISIFFSLLTTGVSSSLPSALYDGLVLQKVSNPVALQISKLPPSAALFATLLGYNPMKILIPSNILSSLPIANQNTILGTTFFPNLISQPFIISMRMVFYLGAMLTFMAAIFSIFRGERYVYSEQHPQIVKPK